MWWKDDGTEGKENTAKTEKNMRSFGNEYHIFKDTVAEDWCFFMYIGRKMNKKKSKKKFDVKVLQCFDCFMYFP